MKMGIGRIHIEARALPPTFVGAAPLAEAPDWTDFRIPAGIMGGKRESEALGALLVLDW